MSGSRLGILGTGLMGGSIGLAARARGWYVMGCDGDEATVERALRVGAIDRAGARNDLYADCDVVAICTHITATLDEIASLRSRSLRDELLVLDIASVKAPIAAAAGGIAAFVPTHPMAGSERTGPEAARADLFEGRTWCYVPTHDRRRSSRACAFIASLGATPIAVDARKHDRVVALTSHLPQLLAYAFTRRVERIAEEDADLVAALSGPAAREFLRLGRSSRAMWDDIFAHNGDAVGAEVRALLEVPDVGRISG